MEEFGYVLDYLGSQENNNSIVDLTCDMSDQKAPASFKKKRDSPGSRLRTFAKSPQRKRKSVYHTFMGSSKRCRESSDSSTISASNQETDPTNMFSTPKCQKISKRANSTSVMENHSPTEKLTPDFEKCKAFAKRHSVCLAAIQNNYKVLEKELKVKLVKLPPSSIYQNNSFEKSKKRCHDDYYVVSSDDEFEKEEEINYDSKKSKLFNPFSNSQKTSKKTSVWTKKSAKGDLLKLFAKSSKTTGSNKKALIKPENIKKEVVDDDEYDHADPKNRFKRVISWDQKNRNMLKHDPVLRDDGSSAADSMKANYSGFLNYTLSPNAANRVTHKMALPVFGRINHSNYLIPFSDIQILNSSDEAEDIENGVMNIRSRLTPQKADGAQNLEKIGTNNHNSRVTCSPQNKNIPVKKALFSYASAKPSKDLDKQVKKRTEVKADTAITSSHQSSNTVENEIHNKKVETRSDLKAVTINKPEIVSIQTANMRLESNRIPIKTYSNKKQKRISSNQENKDLPSQSKNNLKPESVPSQNIDLNCNPKLNELDNETLDDLMNDVLKMSTQNETITLYRDDEAHISEKVNQQQFNCKLPLKHESENQSIKPSSASKELSTIGSKCQKNSERKSPVLCKKRVISPIKYKSIDTNVISERGVNLAGIKIKKVTERKILGSERKGTDANIAEKICEAMKKQEHKNTDVFCRPLDPRVRRQIELQNSCKEVEKKSVFQRLGFGANKNVNNSPLSTDVLVNKGSEIISEIKCTQKTPEKLNIKSFSKTPEKRKTPEKVMKNYGEKSFEVNSLNDHDIEDDLISLHPDDALYNLPSDDENADGDKSPRHNKFGTEKQKSTIGTYSETSNNVNRRQPSRSRFLNSNLVRSYNQVLPELIPNISNIFNNQRANNMNLLIANNQNQHLSQINMIRNIQPLLNINTSLLNNSYEEHRFEMNKKQCMKDMEESQPFIDNSNVQFSRSRPKTSVSFPNDEQDVSFIFKSYCFSTLKSGTCDHYPSCLFNKNLSAIEFTIKSKPFDYVLKIYDYILYYCYEEFLVRSWKNILMSFIKEGYQLLNKVYSSRKLSKKVQILESFIEVRLEIANESAEDIVRQLIGIIANDDAILIHAVFAKIKPKIREGMHWELVKLMCVNVSPPKDIMEIIILDCLNKKRSESHVKEVHDKIMSSEFRKEIASFDPESLFHKFHNFYNAINMKYSVPSVNQTQVASGIGQRLVEQAVSPSSGVIEVIRPPQEADDSYFSGVNLHNLDEPHYAGWGKKRFFKFYHAVDGIKSAEEFGEYDQLCELLDELGKRDFGNNLLLEAFYKIICKNLVNSKSTIKEIFKIAGNTNKFHNIIWKYLDKPPVVSPIDY